MFFYAEPDDVQTQPTGITANTVFFNNTVLNFNNTYIGASDEIILTISATGQNSELVTLSDNSNQFFFSPSSFTLSSGSNQQVTVTFSPTSWGVKTANLIASSSGGSSATASLVGVCVADPLIITSSVGTLNFGSGYVSETSSATFIVSAGGTVQDIVLMSDDTDQFDFSPSSFSMTGANQTQEVTVYFTPTSNGSKVGLLTLSASGGDVAHVSLSGSSIYQPLLLTPSVNNLQFNETYVGQTSSKQFNINAIGTGSETITFNNTLSDFYVFAGNTINITGGQNYRLAVAFAPTTTGSKSDTLNFSSSGGTTGAISLQGTAKDQFYLSSSVLLKGEGINSTSIIDNSSNNLEIIVNGGAVISTLEYKNGSSSLYFNGTNSYLSLGSQAAPSNFNFGTGNFTIEGWIRPNSVASSRTIYGNYGRTASNAFRNGAHLLRLFGGKLDFYVYPTGQLLLSNATIPTGSWTHVAVARQGTTFRMFINGVLDKSVTVASNYELTPDPLHAPTVGAFWQTTSAIEATSWFNGWIDDFRITKGVARYTGNFIPPDSL